MLESKVVKKAGDVKFMLHCQQEENKLSGWKFSMPRAMLRTLFALITSTCTVAHNTTETFCLLRYKQIHRYQNHASEESSKESFESAAVSANAHT